MRKHLLTILLLAGAVTLHAAEIPVTNQTFVFQTGPWEISGSLSPAFSPSLLKNIRTGVVRADLPYRYTIGLMRAGKKLTGAGLRHISDRRGKLDDGTAFFEVTGSFPQISPDILQVVQTFRGRADADWIEEEIVLVNKGDLALRITEIDFSFGKSLYDKATSQWDPLMRAHELLAVPFLVDPENHRHRHPLSTLQNGNEGWKYQGKPRLLSEAWALTDGRDGFLFSHYSQDLIRLARAQAIYNEEGIELRFGGSGAEIEKEEANTIVLLQPGQRQSLGISRYADVPGGYTRAALEYRGWMDSKGHTKPDSYQPPLHWEPHYDNPWWTFSREHILEEGRKGAEMGCELLYLDPRWDKICGGIEWDTERLGDFAGFNDSVKALGLQGTGLHIMGDFVGGSPADHLKVFPGSARRDAKGGVILPQNPCFASKQWSEPKEARLKNLLAEDDLKFLMFDFHRWPGSCWDKSHGHSVPLTRREHAQAYYSHINRIKAVRPDVLIEAHDAIVAGVPKIYLPKYYGHTGGHRWDEHWGFEFMHNPLLDLVEGRALSLYYYRLAYDIPMYLHIPMYADNDNLLMFWWYASTVQHLGIGGTRADFATKGGGGLLPLPQSRFDAYQKAVAEYKPLRKFFIEGTFHGLGEYAHLHVRPDLNQAVLMVFNLEQEPVERTLRFKPSEVGLKSVESADGADVNTDGDDALIHVTIPAVSPTLIPLNFHSK